MLARLTLAAALAAGAVADGPAADAPQLPIPRFEAGACPAWIATDERVTCGVLVTRENRARPDSRAIRLPVLRFMSRAATPAPDPVLFVPGGPGLTSVGRRRSARGNPLLDRRDLIVLEPRGARHAEPALECPEIDAVRGEVAAGRLRAAAAEAAFVAAAARCRAALVAAGVDLDGYTSAATADDIEDLRRLLGIAEWNLQGLSYGTRLVLTVLRRHPEGVRSVVLDSVLPPEVGFDEVASANLWRALDAVFAGCAIDRACGAAYPDLRRRFAELVAAAERAPLALHLDPADTGGRAVEVRGAEVVDAIYAALHDPLVIPHIPRIVANAAAGRYGELEPLIRGNQGPSSFAWGLRYSVWCAEEMPFQDAARIAAQLSPAMGLGGIDETTASPALCRARNVAAAAAVESQPVTSDVPALIFAGELDPDTPPEWGRRLLDRMPRARLVELRGMSHGAGQSPCAAAITRAFLDAPAAPLDADCALRLRGADFALGAPPVP